MKVQLGLARDAIALAQRLIKELKAGYSRESPEFDPLYEIELGLEWTFKRIDQLYQCAERGR
jgi:hypothetical protein